MAQPYYSSVSNEPLLKVIDTIQSKENIIFSYDVDIVKPHMISYPSGRYSLDNILNIVFDNLPISVERIDTTHFALVPASIAKTTKKYSGYIKSINMDNDKEPMVNAFIRIPANDMYVESNQEGYFEFYSTAPKAEIIVSYLGFLPDTLLLYPGKCETYYLKEDIIDCILIVDYLSSGVRQASDKFEVKIEPKHLALLPGTVNADVLNAIQFLHGINSPTESFDNIQVRGGTPDQNLILWDDIPIYQTSHFFGNISALNPYIADKVNVYRSGISSVYGGRVSSLIDITSEQIIVKNFTVKAGINMTQAHLEVGIPLWKNASVSLATRASTTEKWTTPTFLSYADKVFQGTKLQDVEFNDPLGDRLKFNDGNLKWKWKWRENEFEVSSIGSLNNLIFNNEKGDVLFSDNLSITNKGASFIWKKAWSNSFSSKLTFTSTDYLYNYQLNTFRLDSMVQLPYYFKTKNFLQDGGVKLIMFWNFKKNHSLTFGSQYIGNDISFDLEQKNRGDHKMENFNFRNELSVVFGDYEVAVPDLIKLNVGLRYQRSLQLKNNYFEPRLRITTDIFDDFKLKIGTGKHFQFVSQVVVFDINDLGFSNKIWVAADLGLIPVIESNQWTAGVLYNKDDWTIDIDGYVKELAGLTTLSTALEGQPFSTGNARIRGLDMLLRRSFGRYTSWISYTLSATKYEFTDISETTFPAPQDQTHNFQWVNLYKKNNWEASIGLQLKSGLPFTKAIEIDTITNNNGSMRTIIKYGDINTNRLKPYLRLDASASYHFTLSNKFNHPLKGYVAASIKNITNYTNILGRRYSLEVDKNTDMQKIYTINQRGLRFTPNLSIYIEI